MEKLDIKTPAAEYKAIRHLKIYTRQDVLSLTRLRRFETKLGERLQVLKDADHLAESLVSSNAKYVLLGIPEDLGAKGNFTALTKRYETPCEFATDQLIIVMVYAHVQIVLLKITLPNHCPAGNGPRSAASSATNFL